jgi:prepilin-type processing-associated H-X9-DG protein
MYHHGRSGYAITPYLVATPAVPTPDITGANQLFGDGSVRWKVRNQFPLLDMEGAAS